MIAAKKEGIITDIQEFFKILLLDEQDKKLSLT